MKTHNLTQGTQEWHDFRANHFTASDAPAMLGLSKYSTRNDLLLMKKTGKQKPVNSFMQAKFDEGHRSEELARPIAEIAVGADLFPVTATSDEWEKISASFDGVTMVSGAIFEHKLFNEKLIAYIKENDDLPDTHWPQVEQQLYVSGAEFCLFVVSDGTRNNYFQHKYTSKPERIKRVLDGWEQFEADLDSFEPPTSIEIDDEGFKVLAEQYAQAKAESDEAAAKLKELEFQIKSTAEATGANEVKGFGLTVKSVERKGSVDYSKIEALKAVNLDDYRKEPTVYFSIKSA